MYFVSIYSGLLLMLAIIIPDFESYNPGNWSNLTRYVAVMSTVTISNALIFGTVVVSTLLLMKRYRGEKALYLLKQFLLGSLIMAFVSVGVDSIYQAWESIFLDVYDLVVSAIWYFYFVRSDRVKHVFLLQDFRSWRQTKQAVSWWT
jgi:hypothetical protein